MATTCEILNMFNGDRSNPMYLQLKQGMFEMGANCDCGAKISAKSVSKNKCEATIALANHLVYPTYCILDRVEEDASVKHWALVLDICKIATNETMHYFFQGFTHQNEDFEDDIELQCPLSEVKKGHTLVVLYPTKIPKMEKNKLVMVYDPDSYFVFKASSIDVDKEAAKLLKLRDLVEEKKELECFGCGAKTSVIMQCSACKLAKYCSKECQEKAWKLCHKNLCKQSEILLRVASLPRHQDKPSVPCFSFNLDLEPEVQVEDDDDYYAIPIPPYVYKSEFVQRPLNQFISEKVLVVSEIPTKETRCGLCNKNSQECYLKNSTGLIQTNCCKNWVCDDSHMYKMGSYQKNSCDRSHGKYTICGIHFHNDHKGSWKTCKKCKTENKKVMYDDYATNKYNFEKIKVKKEEIWCRNCDFISYDLNDFSGKTPCCSLDDNYFCKKPACKKVGGFDHIDSNDGAFMFSSNNPMAEENQRIMSLARLRAFPNNTKSNVDEVWKEAEKLLQEERYSPALRCFSKAIDGIVLTTQKVEELKFDEKIKLIKLYLKRAHCLMKMANQFGKIRYATLANEDCDYIQNTSSLKEILNNADENNNKTLATTLLDLKKKSKQFIELKTPVENVRLSKQQSVGHNRNRRNAHNRGNNQNRNNRRQQQNASNNNSNRAHSHKNEAKHEENEADIELDVKVCTKLVNSGQAINALSLDDQCPICYIQWSNFVDPSIAVILPCSHACCATCLLRFQRECEESQETDDDECLTLSCVLCRKKIPRTTIERVAHFVVTKKLIGSFNILFKNLPFDKQEYEDLIVSLLLNKSIEFDVSKVENSLFNMIGLVDNRQVDQKLNHEEKQKFYEIARAPVLKLQEEYSKLRQVLVDINDTDSEEWKMKKLELQGIQKRLHEARKNAASDIFERMNSFGNMGAILVDDLENASRLHIDLHGLHINEAKEKVNEYVVPILPALKKIIIVTGQGNHSESGECVLKEAIKQYLLSLNIKCLESTKNKGALCVYYE